MPNKTPFYILGIALLILVIIVSYFVMTNHQDSNKSSTQQSASQSSSSSTPVQTQSSGLVKLDTKVGNGSELQKGQVATFYYTGKLENGTVFDSTDKSGKPFTTTIGVGQVIEGWDKGLIGMKVGGQRKLTIPYSMAYGEEGIPGVIPAKSTLIFDVELLEVK